MFNSFIIYGAILAATMLQALPVAAVPTTALAKSPIPGYRVEAMTWEIQTTPGGPTVNVTGTIEQVIQFAEKQNPDFRSDFGLGDDTPIDLKSTPSLGGFVKGFYDLVYLVECFRVNTKSANLGTFEEVIEDLHNQPRENEATLGPGVCTQFGCKEKTVVWWCNERNDISVTAEYSQLYGTAHVLLGCQNSSGEVNGRATRGIEGDWSITVKGDDVC